MKIKEITKNRIFQLTSATLIILIFGLGCFWFGFSNGQKTTKNISITGAENITDGMPSSTSADFGVFWQAWQDVNDLYLRNPDITNKDKMYGAINGLVQSLNDPYSEFFSPVDSKQFMENVTGDFGGIGAELGMSTSSQIVVISAIKDTPAANIGLKTGDIIVKINGTSTQNMNLDEAVGMIRGKEGTPVTLTIFRTGWDNTKDFTIVRANIKIPTVDFEMKGDLAHISLYSFNQDAEELFYQALQKAANANAKGIILDLRGDPGGYLEVAVDLSGYFLKPGTLVVKEVGRSVPEQDFKSSGNGALDNIPMVILIDGGSASASEILAGALHDNRGIKLIGEKSFGKGTVQEVQSLSDGSSLKITVAHWVLPSGRILDHDGLVPDYPVAITEQDIKNKVDPQLEKAIEVLNSEIKTN
jgi:carboxyl-terminal processing protease